MRVVLRGLLVLSLALSIGASDAWAKKDDKDKKKGKDEGVMLTGIEAFDDVFVRVGEIDSRLTSAETELRTGKRNLNTALELKKGTPISDGLAELQKVAEGKLELAIDDLGVPKLQASDAVPSNVQSAVDAVNGLTANLTTSLTDLTAIAPEIEALVKQTQKMPAKLQQEFSGGGASLVEKLFELPKTTKALTHDIDLTLGLADRTTSLTGRMTDILSVVQTEFAPGGSHQGRPASGEKVLPKNRSN